LGRVDLDLKDRILHALADIAAGLRNAAQSAGAARLGGPHVVGYEHQHGYFQNQGG
jgi:hypothetical protein